MSSENNKDDGISFDDAYAQTAGANSSSASAEATESSFSGIKNAKAAARAKRQAVVNDEAPVQMPEVIEPVAQRQETVKVVAAEEKRPKPVAVDGSFMGVDISEEESQSDLIQVPNGDVSTSDVIDAEETPGYMQIWEKHKTVILAAAAAVVVGIAIMPGKAPIASVAPTAVPVQAPVAPVTPVTAAPTAQVAPGTEGLAMPTGINIHEASSSPDSQARLQSDLAKDAQAIPPSGQVCTNADITSFDKVRCDQVGAVQYFKCAPDGRRWDVLKPGCENG